MKRAILLLPAIALVLSILACTLSGPAPTAIPSTESPEAPPTRTSAPTANPSLTPSPVATATPTARPTATARAVPAGRILIMVLGSDWRLNKGYRTDVVMLLTMDTRKRTVTAVSFPRDLYVTIPGWERNRINTAMPRGGFDLLADTFEINFGLRPDYFVMVDMGAFTEIVDGLDGVTVDAAQSLRDKCDRSLDLADDEGFCAVASGPVEMDGETALWYVRSRSSSSDIDRLRRAQEVLLAIFSKLMSLNAIAHWPEFYADYQETVRTNIEAGDLVPLLPAIVQISRDPSRITRYAVTWTEVTPYRAENGASVLLPDYHKIGEILDQAAFAP